MCSPKRLEQLAGNFAMQRWVQASLRVGAIDDPQEREADEAASCGGCNDITPCTACADKKKVRRSARTTSSHALSLSEARMARLGGGTSLDAALRLRMQRQLGHDFSRVRVHTGPPAADAARSINARAFTTGSDVVFDEGEFRPGTREGDRLLAHELAHVAQNGGETTTVRRVVNGDIRRISITDAFANALNEEELVQQMQILREEMASHPPESAEYRSAELNMAVLQRRRGPNVPQPGQLVERPPGLPLDGGYQLTPIDVPPEVAGQIPNDQLVPVPDGGAGLAGFVGDRRGTLVTGPAGGAWMGMRTNLSTYGFASVGENAIGIIAFPPAATVRTGAPSALRSTVRTFLTLEHPAADWGHTAIYVRQGGRITVVRGYAPASLGQFLGNPTLSDAVRAGTAEVPAAVYAEQGIIDMFNVSTARSVEWPVTPQDAATMAEGLPEGSLYGAGQPLSSGVQYTAVPGRGCTGTNCTGWALNEAGPRASGLSQASGQSALVREMARTPSQPGVAASGGLSRGMFLLKWGGRVMLVVGVALIPIEVALARPEDRVRTGVGATAGFLGGLAAGAAAGLICGPGALVCSVVFGIGLGLAFSFGSRALAEGLYDAAAAEPQPQAYRPPCPGQGRCHDPNGPRPDWNLLQNAGTASGMLPPPHTQQLSGDDIAVIRQWLATQPRTSGAQR